jgi:chromosomal replication initiator protein
VSGREEIDLDPGLTFDAFVVGPTNRLAAAAGRRAAESPGSSFNPLYLYSPSGLGKSHILGAIARHALRARPEERIAYRTLEDYLEELMRQLERGGQGAMHEPFSDVRILLLDDVQFITGQAQAQHLLLQTIDRITEQGGQVVLASDRPPSEIDGIDSRLMTRFSDGLIVDMGAPDYETRVAIIRRKAAARGSELAEGVAELLGRYPFRNVRELQGALNKVLILQDVEDRKVAPDDVVALLGEPAGVGGRDPGAAGKRAPWMSEEEPEREDEPRWKQEVQGAIRAAEAAGFEAGRLARLLDASGEPDGWSRTLEVFRSRIHRLEEIRTEILSLSGLISEEVSPVLRNPDRMEEAEQALLHARERARPFPPVEPGPELASCESEYGSLAVRAATQLVSGERPEYSPLFVHSPVEGAGIGFLSAAARTFGRHHREGRVGLTSIESLSSDFIRAITEGVAEAWRERWWSVDVLLVHGVESLSGTERAQEEFFHLFEALSRRGVPVLLAADRPPEDVAGVDPRLSSRFEGGLVLELRGGAGETGTEASDSTERDAPDPVAEEVPAFPPRERVVWDWPVIEERILAVAPRGSGPTSGGSYGD